MSTTNLHTNYNNNYSPEQMPYQGQPNGIGGIPAIVNYAIQGVSIQRQQQNTENTGNLPNQQPVFPNQLNTNNFIQGGQGALEQTPTAETPEQKLSRMRQQRPFNNIVPIQRKQVLENPKENIKENIKKVEIGKSAKNNILPISKALSSILNIKRSSVVANVSEAEKEAIQALNQ